MENNAQTRVVLYLQHTWRLKDDTKFDNFSLLQLMLTLFSTNIPTFLSWKKFYDKQQFFTL